MSREYVRNGKPVFHASNLAYYFDCPKKMKLSEQHETQATKPQQLGLLFEFFVLGSKGNVTEDELCGRTDSDKRKGLKEVTVLPIKQRASEIQQYFGKGEPFVKLEYETEHFILQGEADFIGQAKYGDETFDKAIADLKYTGDIERIWNGKKLKFEYLQSVVYPYLYMQNYGDVLPFIYNLVQDEPRFFKQILVKPTAEDFEWLERFLDRVSSDLFFSPNASRETCLGQFGNMRCPYLVWCGEGRELVEGNQEIIFSELVG